MDSVAAYSLMTQTSWGCQIWDASNYGLDCLSTSLDTLPAAIMAIELLNQVLLFNGHRNLENAHQWLSRRLKIRPSVAAFLTSILPSVSTWGYERSCGKNTALLASKWQELITLGRLENRHLQAYNELEAGLGDLSPYALKLAASQFLKRAFPKQEAAHIHEGISNEEFKIYFKILIQEARDPHRLKILKLWDSLF